MFSDWKEKTLMKSKLNCFYIGDNFIFDFMSLPALMLLFADVVITHIHKHT